MKTKSKITQGEWSIADQCAEELVVVSEDTNTDVAFLPGWGDENRGECEANARLISAAPDLLAALKLCVSILRRFPSTDPNGEVCGNMVPSEARQAIKKAEGL